MEKDLLAEEDLKMVNNLVSLMFLLISDKIKKLKVTNNSVFLYTVV